MSTSLTTNKTRNNWGSNLVMIFAVAGSAIGFGNLLRFPAVAIHNGGGAFMIPYFVCLLLLGLPMVWLEWSLGRFAGYHGHGTSPGAFQILAPKKPWLKYLGILGLVTPLIIFIYYTYLESWTLGYVYFSIFSPEFQNAATSNEQMSVFFKNFCQPEGSIFGSSAWWFFNATFLANFTIIYLGIQSGIEKMCKWVIPTIFILCSLMIIQLAYVNHIEGMNENWTFFRGLGNMWEPDFHALLKPKTWLAAAGQTFFTLSIGIGVVLTYSSYLKREDDVALSGLTAASINETVEVVLGGSLLIPAVFMFFGPEASKVIDQNGMFGLSFITMPLVINKTPFPIIINFTWFSILFLAGITSTISLLQSLVSFLEDEFNWSKKKTIFFLGTFTFALTQLVIIGFKHGVVDELDTWGGMLFITAGALLQILICLYFRGIDNIWEDINLGAKIKIPKIFKFILAYITPLMLITILGSWIISDGMDFIKMVNIKEEDVKFILATRIGIFSTIIFIGALIHFAWKNNRNKNYHNHIIAQQEDQYE